MAHLDRIASFKCTQPLQYSAFSLFAFFGHSSHICESFKGKVLEMLCVRSIQVHSLYSLGKPETLVCKQWGREREGLTGQPGFIFSFSVAYDLVFW